MRHRAGKPAGTGAVRGVGDRCTPTLAAFAAALPPVGAQFASWGGPAPLMRTPTLAAFAAALPPVGAQFASWGGPAPLMRTPTLAAFAAALPPVGAQFASWGGPAPLMRTPALAAFAAALPPVGARTGPGTVRRRAGRDPARVGAVGDIAARGAAAGRDRRAQSALLRRGRTHGQRRGVRRAVPRTRGARGCPSGTADARFADAARRRRPRGAVRAGPSPDPHALDPDGNRYDGRRRGGVRCADPARSGTSGRSASGHLHGGTQVRRVGRQPALRARRIGRRGDARRRRDRRRRDRQHPHDRRDPEASRGHAAAGARSARRGLHDAR